MSPTDDGVPYSDYELKTLWEIEGAKISQERAEDHGRFIKNMRLQLGLKRPAFVAEVSKLGQEMTADYLNKIESGTRHLGNASVELRDAIRAVLGVSLNDWVRKTGLYTPGAPIYEQWRAEQKAGDSPGVRAYPGPIPPVVPFCETKIRIPEALQVMVDNNSTRYPELKEPRIQKMLAAPRNYGGADVGPQTEEDWLEYWITNRRWYIKK